VPKTAAIKQGPKARVVIPPEIQRLLQDPIAFGEAIGYKGDHEGRKKFGPMHREIMEHVAYGNRVAIAEPRNHAKSTCVTVILPMWKLARNPDRRIMLGSAELGLGHQMLGEIRDRLNGDLELRPGLFVPVRRVFPHLTLSKAHRKKSGPVEELNIAGRTAAGGREPSLFASSPGTGNAGKHPTDIHFDDLQNEKNSRTYAQRQKVIDYIKQAVPIARNPYKSPICAVMTAWAPDDAYCYLRDHPMWTMVTRGVWDGVNPATGEKDGTGPGPNGSWPLCPSFMTAEEIYKTLDEVGEVFFAAQYLNDPIPAEDALFDKPMIEAFEDLSELAPVGGKLRIPAPSPTRPAARSSSGTRSTASKVRAVSSRSAPSTASSGSTRSRPSASASAGSTPAATCSSSPARGRSPAEPTTPAPSSKTWASATPPSSQSGSSRTRPKRPSSPGSKSAAASAGCTSACSARSAQKASAASKDWQPASARGIFGSCRTAKGRTC